MRKRGQDKGKTEGQKVGGKKEMTQGEGKDRQSHNCVKGRGTGLSEQRG